jgi:hypothetical protein
LARWLAVGVEALPTGMSLETEVLLQTTMKTGGVGIGSRGCVLAGRGSDHGLKADIGSYSDKEFYLDAPEAFVDFVIEATTPDLADNGVTA